MRFWDAPREVKKNKEWNEAFDMYKALSKTMSDSQITSFADLRMKEEASSTNLDILNKLKNIASKAPNVP